MEINNLSSRNLSATFVLLFPKVRFYHRALNLYRALLKIIFCEPDQCTQVYTKPRLSSKNEKIFPTHLTIQFIDLEMLFISVKQGIDFGTFPFF